MQKKRPDEWKHPRFEIGRLANNVNVGKFGQGLAFEMIENARAHVRRRLAESEYLNERDALLREHNPPRISCNPINTETGFFGNLPSDVAIEVDTARDNISRVEHTGGKVNPSGTGGMGIHDAQYERTIAGQQGSHREARPDVPVGKAPITPSDETCVISLEQSALQRGVGDLKIAQEQDTPVPQLGLCAPQMREIVFDLGAPVRSKRPWHGRNKKIQALNGNDIDVGHFACSAPCGAPQKFDLIAIDRKT
jgi:hypothetical protein